MLVATRLVTCGQSLLVRTPATALFGAGTHTGMGTVSTGTSTIISTSRTTTHSYCHRLSTRRLVCRTAASAGTITTLEPPGWVEEETVRKSRFVAHAAPASSWPEAKAFIAESLSST